MAQTPTESLEVDVPATALVACPLVEFDMRQVVDCTQCRKFGGLDDRFPGMKQFSFSKRFTVRCFAEPTKRNIVNLAVTKQEA